MSLREKPEHLPRDPTSQTTDTSKMIAATLIYIHSFLYLRNILTYLALDKGLVSLVTKMCVAMGYIREGILCLSLYEPMCSLTK